MVTIHERKTDKLDKLTKWKEEKENLATSFFDREPNIINITALKGDIFNCYIGENIGHEQSNNRPVMIISSDSYNSRTSTVIIAPLSTKIRTKRVIKNGRPRIFLKFNSQYRLNKRDFDFLNADSVVKLDQLKTVCKSRLLEKIGCVDGEHLNRINKKISEYLDL